MGRKINVFEVPGVVGPDSVLSVSYHYRGAYAGSTRFMIRTNGEPISFVIQDKEDAAKLARFLLSEIDYEGQSSALAPSFETTGYALKIICNGRAIKTLYHPTILDNGVDSFHYNMLRKSFPEYDSDDYYFVVYGLKDNGMNRETLDTIIDTCVAYQAPVLISGDLRLFRPMTQIDIAGQTGLNNTTVSRGTKDVRIFTAHRNYSLDRNNQNTISLDFPSLFNDGLNGLSTVGIKLKIRSLIEGEDKSNPLTDDEIVNELAHFGYAVARRTVVKYRRDHLGIPNSNQRRIRPY